MNWFEFGLIIQSKTTSLEHYRQFLRNMETTLNGLKRKFWRPIIQKGETSLDSSKISGKPWLNLGEGWPICPNCLNPLRLVLQLNLQDLPQGLNRKFGTGLLQLFCCESDFEIHTGESHVVISRNSGTEVNWVIDEDGTSETEEIDLPQDEGTLENVTLPCWMWACKAFSNSQVVRIIQPTGHLVDVSVPAMETVFPTKSLVGWQESHEYPHPSEMEELAVVLDEKEDKTLTQHRLLAQAGDKLSGWPCWAQSVEYPLCPTCNQAMKQLIFQFESDGNKNFPYPHKGLGVGYLLQCSHHQEQVTFFCQFT
ncbi:MAG: DUF1963 domain-containing protein [Leptolyngbyaceae cyanobacterium CRU_2_3]|nr:DUF1963 domain-containing protein [Leptolyngbyaceae cyanobacterium CRU_2_3]